MMLIAIASQIYAGDINGIVVSSQGEIPIPGANISIYHADTLVYKILTDDTGKFKISLQEGIYCIQVNKEKYTTLNDSLTITANNESREMRLIMEKEAVILNDVIVKANPIYVRNLNDGIIYNLSRDRYAQNDNLLNALNRVPLIMVSSDGSINVAGQNSYIIYLNGKPYSIANADPSQVLRSIPSSNIKQVEVVTRPAERFGENVPIINIITKGKSIDGYNLNINGLGATTPMAKGATSLLGIVKKIQFFAGYTYDLWGQQNQEWQHEYKFNDGVKTITTSNKNNKNRHTHSGRTMFQWEIDTLQQLYADFHINGIERNERIYYEQLRVPADYTSTYLSVSDTWDASMEANLIYSALFRKNSTQKWRVGYRFTINPDNRDYQIEDLSINSLSIAKTKGELYTHNLQIFRRINFSPKVFSTVIINANLRKGSTSSMYSSGKEDDFKYTQILGSLNWNMIWYIDKSKNLWFDFANIFEYADDYSTYLDTHRYSFSYLPSLKLTWQPNWDNELFLAFSSGVNRPSIQMLNPFIGGKIDSDLLQGSPILKKAMTYSLSLGYSYYGKKVLVSPTISGFYTRNAIMSTFDSDNSSAQIVETYSNIPKVKKLSLDLFLSYRPWQWITIRNVSSFGMQNISWIDQLLNQSDIFYSSTSVLSLNLPYSYQFEARFTSYKNTSKAWLRYDPGVLYGFSVSKTFFNGNMVLKAFVDSPFDKHGVENSRTILSSSKLSYDKLWKIQTRSVGLEISLNFKSGKKIGLKRDTSLKDSDIRSGIDN